MPNVMYVGHQGPPPVAAFPDEVYDPTTSPPPVAPEGWRQPAIVVETPPLLMSYIQSFYDVFDPTTTPPQRTWVGLQGYKPLVPSSVFGMPNPGVFAEEVWNPTLVPPGISKAVTQGNIKSYVGGWAKAPPLAAGDVFNPLNQPPQQAWVGLQGWRRLTLKSWSAAVPTTTPPYDPSSDPSSWRWSFATRQLLARVVRGPQRPYQDLAVDVFPFNPALLIYSRRPYLFYYVNRQRYYEINWVNQVPITPAPPVDQTPDFPYDVGGELIVFKQDAMGIYVPIKTDATGRYDI